MNRPSCEVADIIRAAGDNFIEKQRSWLTGFTGKYCLQSNVAGQRLSAAPRPLLRAYTTKAISYNSCAIAIAQSASTTPQKMVGGAEKELLPVPYVHLSSLSPTYWCRYFSTQKLLYALCCDPVQRPCWRSQETQSISEQK